MADPSAADDGAVNSQRRIIDIAQTRQFIMAADARNMIRSSLSWPSGSNSEAIFRPNDTIRVYQRLPADRYSRWHSGYRVIAFTGRHVIAERGIKIVETPSHLVRKVVIADAESTAVPPLEQMGGRSCRIVILGAGSSLYEE